MGSCTSKEAIDFAELITEGFADKEVYLLNLMTLLRHKNKLSKHEHKMVKQLIDKEIEKNVNGNIDNEEKQMD